MRHRSWSLALSFALLLPGAPAAENTGDVAARLVFPAEGAKPHSQALAAAIWLTPLFPEARAAAPPGGIYTLLQKNKAFSPHLLVIPVGSTVHFPNRDPFFHNVFSLFNGRRFDLGLYEAGTTRDVTFPREGVSYIFCNIHPEMSAVILSLATGYYAVADETGRFRMEGVPPGRYVLHVWVEGEEEAALNRLSRLVQITRGHADLGSIVLRAQPAQGAHTNKFGQPYDPDQTPTY